MPTIKDLEVQVQSLDERLARVQVSNSRLRDELTELKLHYTNLVDSLSVRFEAIQDRFRT